MKHSKLLSILLTVVCIMILVPAVSYIYGRYLIPTIPQEIVAGRQAQHQVTDAELASWMTFRDEVTGLTFRYPTTANVINGSVAIEGQNDIFWADDLRVTRIDRPLNEEIAHSKKLLGSDYTKVSINGISGYRYYALDTSYGAEHWIIPDPSGKRTIDFMFSGSRDRGEVLRPYKQAIFSTVKFE